MLLNDRALDVYDLQVNPGLVEQLVGNFPEGDRHLNVIGENCVELIHTGIDVFRGLIILGRSCQPSKQDFRGKELELVGLFPGNNILPHMVAFFR